MDIRVSSFGILMILPLWLIFVIAIKLDDGGQYSLSKQEKTVNGIELKMNNSRELQPYN